MDMPVQISNSDSNTPLNSKLQALKLTLELSLQNLEGFAHEFNQLQNDAQQFKDKLIDQTERCDRKACSSSVALQKVIETKDNVIQVVASVLSRLHESKNFNILDEAFKVLCGETIVMTPPKDSVRLQVDNDIQQVTAPEPKLLDSLIVDKSMKDESVSEIEGTPTGRTSPIIQTKKKHAKYPNESRDKKKCPSSWPTPENKTFKLYYPKTPNGKMKQGKLSFVKSKESTVVDLTSTPEFCGGIRRSVQKDSVNNLPTIKNEQLDIDDTILPSPTSCGSNEFTLHKNLSKSSPHKVSKALSLVKVKSEIKKVKEESENKRPKETTREIDDSYNILQAHRNVLFPVKDKIKLEDQDRTHCDSISLLHNNNVIQNTHTKQIQNSPIKRPLKDKTNGPNMDSISKNVLPVDMEFVKRRIIENVEPCFKESTVRKKSEKRALPGWSCDECEHFYGALYKDDPKMLADKMDECSKHRGRTNPTRSKTPPGFWNPRWDVPEDTEEFNRRNNAV